MSEQSSSPVGSPSGDDKRHGGNAGPAIDTASVAAVADLADGGKRRGGWPKGKPRTGSDSGGSAAAGSPDAGSSGPRKAKEKIPVDLSGIEAALVGIHAGIAMLTKNPVWEMPASEAEGIAKATANVARHYPKLASHEKLIDWIMLIQVVGMAYGPRLYLSIPEKKEPEKKPTNVAPFPGAVPMQQM